MKMPFVRAKTATTLQAKLDATREKLKEKDRRLLKCQTDLTELLGQFRDNEGVESQGKSLGHLLASLDPRKLLSLRYLRGDGLEIGALHRATPTASGARTRYYDYMSAADSRKRLPELSQETLAEIDYIGNGETLDLIANSSQDYIIANHMLEHCQNVIGTLRVFWSKLKTGGALFITLPDKRYTFDYKREVTPFEHLEEDDRNGPSASLYQHYLDYLMGAHGLDPSQVESEGTVRAKPHVDIHFHVWTQADMLEMFIRLQRDHGFNWEIDCSMRNHGEVVTVLRKEDVVSWNRAAPATMPA
ncbi:MAG: methyltransferase domain-containing protein [Verrucomicrobium sp.]|nr:methyltransferase domain-containing protein [Verrucomicrobium sp.]